MSLSEVSDLQPVPESGDDASGTLRHGIQIGSMNWLIPQGMRSELIPVPSSITSLPGAAPWFLGLINHRGEVVPVYNIAAWVSRNQSSFVMPKWILLLDKHPNTVGILTDHYPAALHPTDAVETPQGLPDALSHSITQTYRIGETEWLSVDVVKLFSTLKNTMIN
jgi:twitching motility protein PilI